jgi:short-subunit dehydrogenase
MLDSFDLRPRRANRCLVNNAAFVRWKDAVDMSLEDELQTMRAAYDGMVHCTRAVLPSMLAARRGRIVNIGSSAGKIFVGFSSAAYAAAKAAVDAYTRTLDVELERTGVATTPIRPGTIGGTEFFRRHVDPRRMPRMADFFPVLSPSDVAAKILRAVEGRRAVADFPRLLRLVYIVFALAPRMTRWLTRRGGNARTALGERRG